MTPPDAPVVSVIVPTYDRGPLLREAVASVLAQTFTAWELIVVDDGSTDDSLTMLETLGERRLVVVRSAHTGIPARVRNAGLRVARGEFVALLDSDDLWLPDKLAVQVPALRESGCRWGYTGFRRVDLAGRTLGPEGIQPWHPHRGAILEALLRVDAIVPLPTVLVERRLLLEVGGFDESLPQCEDYDLWFRLAARGPAHLVEEALACVRVHEAHLQADREGVHAAWVRVYAKAARAMPEGRLASLCHERRVAHLVAESRLAAGRGARGRALALLAAAAGRGWRRGAWWRAWARALLGPVGLPRQGFDNPRRPPV